MPSMAVVTVKASPVSRFSAAIKTFRTHTRVRADFGILCSSIYANCFKGGKRLKRCAIKLECLIRWPLLAPVLAPVLIWAPADFRARAYPVLPGFRRRAHWRLQRRGCSESLYSQTCLLPTANPLSTFLSHLYLNLSKIHEHLPVQTILPRPSR